MKPESVNPNVRSHLQTANLTTADDIDRCIRIGLTAVYASQFLEHIALFVGAEGVHILNEFYRNFLGMHSQICVDKSNTSPAIRLCDQVSPNGQEGEELQFIYLATNRRWVIRLYKLTSTFDITMSTLVKEFV